MNECSVCREDFGGKIVPAILTCCGEEICYQCCENDRVAKISNLTGNRKKIQCMLCNEEFHSVNDTPWIVNKPMIKRTNLQVDLSCVREAQAARRLASSTRKDVVSRRSQRNVDVEQNNNEESGDDRGSDNNDSTSTSSEIETHESDEESRFSTIDEEKKDEEEVLEEEESVVGDEDTSAMPSNSTQLYKIGTKVSKVFFDGLMGKLRPYVGTITSYDPKTMYYRVVYDEDGDAEDVFASGVKEILVGSSSVVGDEDTSTLSSTSASAHSQERQVSTRITTRRQSQRRQSKQNVAEQKLLVTVNGKTYSEDIVGDIDTPARKRMKRADESSTINKSGRKPSEDNEDVKMSKEDTTDFNQILSKANNLYRIRQFTVESVTPNDKFGRAISDWAISKGYCASSDRVFTGEEPDNAMKYLRETNLASIKDSCREYKLFDMCTEKNLTKYCSSYKRFACMEKGDMIAMNIPGPTRKGEAYFGVITSNKLILKGPNECKSEGYPAMHMLEGNGYNFNGIMLREVKWMRKGFIRDLPGQKVGMNGARSLPWLIESGPFWLLQASSSGLEMMNRKAFLDSTKAL